MTLNKIFSRRQPRQTLAW